MPHHFWDDVNSKGTPDEVALTSSFRLFPWSALKVCTLRLTETILDELSKDDYCRQRRWIKSETCPHTVSKTPQTEMNELLFLLRFYCTCASWSVRQSPQILQRASEVRLKFQSRRQSNYSVFLFLKQPNKRVVWLTGNESRPCVRHRSGVELLYSEACVWMCARPSGEPRPNDPARLFFLGTWMKSSPPGPYHSLYNRQGRARPPPCCSWTWFQQPCWNCCPGLKLLEPRWELEQGDWLVIIFMIWLS